MRTTIRLADELLDQARQEAARQGRTLTSLVEEGLRVVLAPRSHKQEEKRVFPVSSARGGPLPGVDINRSAELADLLELD